MAWDLRIFSGRMKEKRSKTENGTEKSDWATVMGQSPEAGERLDSKGEIGGVKVKINTQRRQAESGKRRDGETGKPRKGAPKDGTVAGEFRGGAAGRTGDPTPVNQTTVRVKSNQNVTVNQTSK